MNHTEGPDLWGSVNFHINGFNDLVDASEADMVAQVSLFFFFLHEHRPHYLSLKSDCLSVQSNIRTCQSALSEVRCSLSDIKAHQCFNSKYNFTDKKSSILRTGTFSQSTWQEMKWMCAPLGHCNTVDHSKSFLGGGFPDDENKELTLQSMITGKPRWRNPTLPCSVRSC